MQLIDLLQRRASIPAKLLVEPAPDDAQIEQLIKAGLSAPDHAAMRPWRFIVIRGESRNRLGDVFAEAVAKREPTTPEEKIEAQRLKPLRSPLIIAVIARITPGHPKTPEVEQILSAGAAAHQIQLATTALGFGSIWLTGPNARDNLVKEALGIETKDELVGFLYIGTPTIKPPSPGRPEVADHLEYW